MGEANAISAKKNCIFCLKSLTVRNSNKRRKFAFVTRRVPFSVLSFIFSFVRVFPFRDCDDLYLSR